MNKLTKAFFMLTLLFGGWTLSSCEPDGGEPTPTPTGIELLTSTSLIVADGEEEAVLTIKYNGVDVTDSALLYMNKKRVKSNRFSTDKPGAYDFFASYKGKVSKTITIQAANPALYVALPADSQPEKFDGFERKVLVAEGTGTWCGYCPFMIRALELFGESGANADKAVIVATHSSDEFSNAASDAAIRTMRISSFPSCALNLNPEVLVENRGLDMNVENINSMVGMEMLDKARVGISASTAVSVDCTIVGVRAAVKVGAEGNYRINAWLIEDGVPAMQSSNWPEFSDGMAEVLINHNHILRDASCTSFIQGQVLSQKGACAAGEVIEFYHEFDAVAANVTNVANCKIAVLVTATSGTSSNYYVNNIIECPVGGSVPFAYNK